MATRDYTLGKGKITFLPDNVGSLATLAAGGFQDLGNAPAVAVSLAVEKIEHQSSRDGIGLVDASVVTKTSASGTFTLDEPNSSNLQKFFMDTAVSAASSATVVAQAVQKSLFTALNVWYPINLSGGAAVKTNSAVTADPNNSGTAVGTLSGTQTAGTSLSYTVRCSLEGASGAAEVQTRVGSGTWSAGIVVTDATPFNVLNVAADTGLDFTIDAAANLDKGDEFSFSVAAVDPAGLRVTDITAFVADSKVEGTDYMLDSAAGLVMFLTTIGTITTCTVSGKTGNKDVVQAFQTANLKGWVYYVANPAAGVPVDVIGYCRIAPTGDFNLIGTDWTQMQFTIDFLKVDGYPLVQLETRTKV